MLALILAVSMSSTDIDEFFTLPSWMPKTVASKDTPGSSPSDGVGGWYVETVESVKPNHYNVVADATILKHNSRYGWWTIDRFVTNITDNVNQGWNSSDQYHVSGQIDFGRHGANIAFSHSVNVTLDDPDFNFHCEKTYYWDGSEKKLLVDFSCAADGFETNYVWKTKAARLTPEIQAGVISSFAGYCERQYYASQGQTNGWDTSTYGPTNNKKKFWFSPDDRTVVNITTNSYWRAETSMGNYDPVSFRYYSGWPGPGWSITSLGNTIAQAYGYFYRDTNPRFVSGTKDDTQISGNATLTYRSQGGTTDYSTNFTFTAHKYDIVTTNEYHYDGSEFLYVPTNRTVTSRRLLQYDNIAKLSYYLSSVLGHGSFVHSASFRPGWFSGSNGYGDDPNVWWSSTEGNIFAGARIVPDLADSEVPTSEQMWDECSQTFGCFDWDDVWNAWPTEPSAFPGNVMMGRLSFGQSGFDSDVCKPAHISTSVKQLIETNFPHADGYAITNDTRRLVPDSLCCINQMLSLMDMTYSVPDVSYPSVGTNMNYHNEIACFGTVNCKTLDRVGNHFEATFDQDQSIYSWGGYSSTNYCWMNSEISSGNSIKERVTRTKTDTLFDISVSGLRGVVATEEILKSVLMSEASLIGTVDFVATFSDGSGFVGSGNDAMIGLAYSITCFQNDEQWTFGDEIAVPVGSIDGFSTYYCYGREYCHLYTFDYAKLGITQPGWQGASRVTESKYGAVLATHSRRLSNNALNDIAYLSTASSCIYNSYQDSYSGRFGLVGKFNEIQDLFSQRFANDYGVNPSYWASIIPISQTDANKVRNSIRITACSINASPTGWTTTYTGTYDADSQELSVTDCFSTNDRETLDYAVTLVIPTVQETIEKDDPEQEEMDPLSQDAKIGLITRVKWNWRTLHRSE